MSAIWIVPRNQGRQAHSVTPNCYRIDSNFDRNLHSELTQVLQCKAGQFNKKSKAKDSVQLKQPKASNRTEIPEARGNHWECQEEGEIKHLSSFENLTNHPVYHKFDVLSIT